MLNFIYPVELHQPAIIYNFRGVMMAAKYGGQRSAVYANLDANKPESAKKRFRWKALKYGVIIGGLFGSGFMFGSDCGATNPKSWVVKTSSSSVGYVRKGLGATYRWAKSVPGYFTGKKDDDIGPDQSPLEQKISDDEFWRKLYGEDNK